MGIGSVQALFRNAITSGESFPGIGPGIGEMDPSWGEVSMSSSGVKSSPFFFGIMIGAFCAGRRGPGFPPFVVEAVSSVLAGNPSGEGW
eukprot:CAMPEP_0117846494 /NCGR_PEP_ID=MMETSP0949-20121206/19030_1 /TAXON_ID=44440 /ORGANISM="Chattonella subsalsa, Strain CCMP2191" /LENGTH=88 /DNA_ID=CAMNT_0005692517 /DNA_START=311 /DNA_END=574 /DNA_ORIENTATION=+